MTKKYIGVAVVLSSLIFGSCKKFLQIDPPINRVTESTVYSSNYTAIAVMTGVYSNFNIHDLFYYEPSLMADELTLYDFSNQSINELYWDNYNSVSQYPGSVWSAAYSTIYTANTVLEHLQGNTSLSPAVAQQLQGEALFIRGLYYFYLVNMYGGVPLVLSTDYKTNEDRGRSTDQEIWDQAESDLRAGKSLLSKNYLDATLMATTTDRVRPTYWLADAMLARLLLYRKKWAGADSAATEMINNTMQFGLVGLDSIVLKNNREAIWQVPVTYAVPWTVEGNTFKLQSTGPTTDGNWPFYLSNLFYSHFEPGDNRKSSWVDSVTVLGVTYRFPYKYKVGRTDAAGTPPEVSTPFRLAEQYLIRAEARAEENETSLAAADLNVIRARAGLGNTTATTPSDLLAAIQQERRSELFTEGHRWFDLKRTGAIDSVMTIVCQQKGAPAWASYKALWPLPNSEFIADPGLKGQQNPGY